jgi:hypothetical protein
VEAHLPEVDIDTFGQQQLHHLEWRINIHVHYMYTMTVLVQKRKPIAQAMLGFSLLVPDRIGRYTIMAAAELKLFSFVSGRIRYNRPICSRSLLLKGMDIATTTDSLIR